MGTRAPRRQMTIAALLALSLGFLSCRSNPDAPDRRFPSPALSILFIGNSLTIYNDLPGVIAALADSAGIGPFEVVDVSIGGYGLEDHWIDGRTRSALGQGGWDLVILQQGPSATEGRPSLIEYSRLLAAESRAVGAEVGLYMVWPSLDRFEFFDGVLDSYRMAAENENALFFPSGEAWRVAWETDPGLALYGPDGFHPSILGTYLAALVIFEQISGLTPIGLPSVLRTEGNVVYSIDPVTARRLQTAAVEANSRHARAVPGWPPEVEGEFSR